MNTKRNSSHRNNHVRPGDASAKIARKPTSVSRMSHWKDQKSWPAVEIERYRINSATRHARRKKPRMRTIASAAPAIHATRNARSLELTQNTVGAYQNARAPPAPRAGPAGNSPPAGCPASRSGRRLRPRTRRTRSGKSRPAPSGTAQWRGSRDTLEDVVRLAVLAGDFACDGPLMTIHQINAPVGIVLHRDLPVDAGDFDLARPTFGRDQNCHRIKRASIVIVNHYNYAVGSRSPS